MKSATTAGDSDFGVAESCVAESCASFEFVDEDGQQDNADGDDEDEKTEQSRSQPPSPPKVLNVNAEGAVKPNGGTTSSICSPSGTSEIGSVFGLRFDPQENKMTLQLTAAPGEATTVPSDGPSIEVSKLQPSR